MSLVSDALKKAQREAALREAREKGLPEPLLAGAQPFRARRERRAQALAAAAVVVALAAGGVAYLWRSSPSERPKTEILSVEGHTSPDATPGIAAAAPAPAPTPASGVPAPAPAANAIPASPSGTSPAPAAPSASAPAAAPAAAPRKAPSAAASVAPPLSLEVSARDSAAPVPAGAPAAPRPTPPAPSAGAVRPAEEASYVRQATLADGGELRLGGIAWSETAPLAYVNGRLVGVGEMVAGCAVRGIEKESVSLTCSGAALRLRLR